MPGFVAPDILDRLWEPGAHPFGPALGPIAGYNFVPVGPPRMVPPSPVAGQSVRFEADFMDNGTAPAPPGPVLGAVFQIDQQPATFSDDHVAGVPAGGTVTLVANGPGSGLWVATPGSHELTGWVNNWITADRYPDEVSPSFANNSASLSFFVPPPSGVNVFKAGGYEDAWNFVDGMNAFAQETLTTPLIGHTYTWGGATTGLIWQTNHEEAMAWLAADSRRILYLSVGLLQDNMARQWDNTAHDAAWTAFFVKLHSYGMSDRIIVRPGWEMNGSWMPWGPRDYSPATIAVDAAGYDRLWQRKIPLARAVSSLFRFDWCPNGFFTSIVSPFYPGDNAAWKPDIASQDIYYQLQYSGPDYSLAWTSSFLPMLQDQVDFAAAHGLLLGIGEWGMDRDVPGFIDDMFDWFALHDYLFAAFFQGYDAGLGVSFNLTNYLLSRGRYSARAGAFVL